MAAPVDFIKNAPVTSLTTAEALVGAVLTFLATHHVLGDIDVSATTQTIAPFVALSLPAVFGALKWRLVTPYEKVKDLAERDGLVSDADFARISALLDDKLHGWGLILDAEDESGADDESDSDESDSDESANNQSDAEGDPAGDGSETDDESALADERDENADGSDVATGESSEANYAPEHSARELDADTPPGMAAGADS